MEKEEFLKRFDWPPTSTVAREGNRTFQHMRFREMVIEFAAIMDTMLPDGRAKSVAFTYLEDTSMWAHKAIDELDNSTSRCQDCGEDHETP